jgi:hypothetical protein
VVGSVVLLVPEVWVACVVPVSPSTPTNPCWVGLGFVFGKAWRVVGEWVLVVLWASLSVSWMWVVESVVAVGPRLWLACCEPRLLRRERKMSV